MARDSGVTWTDSSWNCNRGCDGASEECRHCYAAMISARFSRPGLPYAGYAEMIDSVPQWTGKVSLVEDHLADPLHWRTPRRIFVNDMSDTFHEALADKDIDLVFDVMEQADWHHYQVLTKRSTRMKKFIRRRYRDGKPPEHIWLGVTVGVKKSLLRIDDLRETPAAVRFLSVEPLLESLGKINLDGIHWVICGGESGHGFRRMDPDWVREVRDQCIAHKIPFIFKQWGGIGHASGCLLDGREWKEFPRPHPAEMDRLITTQEERQ